MSRLVIVIPTWNEALVIEENMKRLQRACSTLLPEYETRYVVADNGSTDETANIVQRLPEVELIQINERGKGQAIRSAWMAHLEDADILVCMDADLAADVHALPALISPIRDSQADIVCGSRFMKGSRVERRWVRTFASYIYRWLQRVILGLPVRDAQCGFKAISTQAAKDLLPLCTERGWMFDTELLAFAVKCGWRIQEIAIDWIEARDARRRSAIHVFRDGWGFISGLMRIRRRVC